MFRLINSTILSSAARQLTRKTTRPTARCVFDVKRFCTSLPKPQKEE